MQPYFPAFFSFYLNFFLSMIYSQVLVISDTEPFYIYFTHPKQIYFNFISGDNPRGLEMKSNQNAKAMLSAKNCSSSNDHLRLWKRAVNLAAELNMFTAWSNKLFWSPFHAECTKNFTIPSFELYWGFRLCIIKGFEWQLSFTVAVQKPQRGESPPLLMWPVGPYFRKKLQSMY